jgi:hypothetical protein
MYLHAQAFGSLVQISMLFSYSFWYDQPKKTLKYIWAPKFYFYAFRYDDIFAHDSNLDREMVERNIYGHLIFNIVCTYAKL